MVNQKTVDKPGVRERDAGERWFENVFKHKSEGTCGNSADPSMPAVGIQMESS